MKALALVAILIWIAPARECSEGREADGAFAGRATNGAPPPELMSALATARIEGPVASWCRAEFVEGQPSFAAAVGSGTGGRYVAAWPPGTVTELSRFEGAEDLACYTASEARKLSWAIGESETVEGKITPRWNGTVVCGFVHDTTAACWQYSPASRTFVEVGRWTT